MTLLELSRKKCPDRRQKHWQEQQKSRIYEKINRPQMAVIFLAKWTRFMENGAFEG